MQRRRTITIKTSPASTTSSLPLSPVIPRKNGQVQYRIEERTRTVYVTSDEDPTKWDQQSITNILRVTEIPETDEDDSPQSRYPIKRSSSQPLESQTPADKPKSSASSPDSKDSPRMTNKSHRREIKSLQFPSPHAAPPSPIRIAAQRSYERPKVLFYHKQDPYYGFTNFSAHPVVYKGKRYPTSEHLFQSFKVSVIYLMGFRHSYFA